MKIEWMNRKGRWKRHVVCPLLTFALAFGMIAAAPALDGAAQAVDISSPCSLTISPGGGEFAEDLEKADVVVDLYKVASAVEDPRYDTYSYQPETAYAGLDLSGEHDSEAWDTLAQETAKIALNGGTPAVTGAVGSQLDLPGCGLYLVVARGNGLADYTTTVTEEDGKQSIATIANSNEFTYSYAPALISLPSKEADENGTISTAGDGDWIYDLSVTLKPARSIRYGSLEIAKTLQSYETSGPATFIFDVEAVLNGATVYSDVVSISFQAAGQKTVLLDKIPVGAQVTVTEVYSGTAYSPSTAASQTVVAEAGQTVTAAFTNTYNSSDKSGGAITNRFDYSTDTGWGWTQIMDNQ